MHYKHTFLFTLILGLVWATLLFGYQNGPDPASNGIFGQASCNASGCHVGNLLNASGGSLTLSGLPAEWTPGQTYPLTVTVARTGAVKYGFQLSAVSDSGNAQAGTLTAGHNRVTVVSAAGVQYAQHNAVATNVAPFTGVFLVNWTAPASATAGTVRFNLAANAANGNVQNTGDFVYERVERVSPGVTVSPNQVSFSLVNQGGFSRVTDGSGNLAAGYVRIQADAGSTTPAGVGIFGLRQNNVLVSEAGVPASPLMTSGRIYAETGTFVRTGLAIANPNSQAATISFTFTNSAGVDTTSGTATVGANSQIAAFLDESTFNGGPSFQGAFTFTSSVPVSVVALRGFTNEIGRFLLTTLPVIDLSAATSTEVNYVPHFADGTGWTTQIILVNPTDNTLTGSVQFMATGSATAAALPATIVIGGQASSSFAYSVPRRSSVKLVTSNPATLTTGSVRINPASGNVTPVPLVVFSYKPGTVTTTEAGVQGVRGTAHRMYVEVTGNGSTPGTIQTGFAITNVGQFASTVTLDLYTLTGTFVAQTSVTVPGNGQVASFVHQLFPTQLTFPFKGVLRMYGGASTGVSVVGLRARYNEAGDFLITTTPPTNENATTTTAEYLFPHIVNGGGYTTQFVLFSGVSGQSSNGNLRFFNQNGSAMVLTLQ